MINLSRNYISSINYKSRQDSSFQYARPAFYAPHAAAAAYVLMVVVVQGQASGTQVGYPSTQLPACLCSSNLFHPTVRHQLSKRSNERAYSPLLRLLHCPFAPAVKMTMKVRRNCDSVVHISATEAVEHCRCTYKAVTAMLVNELCTRLRKERNSGLIHLKRKKKMRKQRKESNLRLDSRSSSCSLLRFVFHLPSRTTNP